MPHNPTHKKTLLDIWSKGKYKTSKDLPSMREKIIPALEFMTGATHVPKGQKPDPLNIAFALPVVGKIGRVGRATKAKGFINRMLKTAEKSQPPRSVVAVQMGKGKEKWVQPFYKSSGTSIPGAGKEGKWMPFMGRQETKDIPGAGKRFYVDTAKDVAIGGEGWWIKGWKTSKDKWSLLAGSADKADPLSHVGPYGSVSREISRLEKKGYFKHAGTATQKKQVNKWLEGYGFNRPRSMSW